MIVQLFQGAPGLALLARFPRSLAGPAKTDRGEVVPYEKALVLGTLFDVVADPTLDPIFIAAMQAQPAPTTLPLAPSRRAVSKAPALFDPGKAL